MLRLAGAAALVLGCSGFGWCICRDMERKAAQLKLLGRVFTLLESEIGYSRATLPEGLARVGGRLGAGRAKGGQKGNCTPEGDLPENVTLAGGLAGNGVVESDLPGGCISEKRSSGSDMQKDGLPEIDALSGGLPETDRLEISLGSCLVRIGEAVLSREGITLQAAWERYMPAWLEKTCLGKKEKELLIAFPEYTGFADGRMQLTALRQFGEEVKQARQKAAKEAESRRKAVFSVSVTGGLLAAILLI